MYKIRRSHNVILETPSYADAIEVFCRETSKGNRDDAVTPEELQEVAKAIGYFMTTSGTFKWGAISITKSQ